MASRWVVIEEVTVLKTTDAALLIELEPGEEVWIPRKCVNDSDSEVAKEGDEGRIVITRSIAEHKEIEKWAEEW